nr:heparinase II/III family protein [Devosia oryzisoli]
MRRWNVKHIRMLLEAAPDFAPFPKAGAGFDHIRAALGSEPLAALTTAAKADIGQPIPALPAELYLDFLRTGRREGYEDAQRERRNMLYRLSLAEWLGGDNEFAAAAENILWARLEETNWAWPAHARTLDMPDRPTVDLAAAMTGLDLAEIDYLLGDRLSPQVRAWIRSEVDRRTITPFLSRNDHWWLHTTPQKQVNNWTAVCVAGVVGAACYLETNLDRLAEIITRGLHSLADYLETFDSQGGSSEGPDYWSYGFGNYVVLAQLLSERTGGALDLFEDPMMREIAQFPVRTVMTTGIWASFSDSDSNPQFHPGLLSHLASRLDLPMLTQLGTHNDFSVDIFNQFVWPLRQYAWPLPKETTVYGGVAHDWFEDMGWMLSRLDAADPTSLRLAVKAGHNDEMHNQNDVGSLIVVSGGTVVLTDPGRGRYSKAYFSPQRYDNLMASSRGHSVPVVNGQEQAEGRDRAATVVEHVHGENADRLVFDFADAYPDDAGLQSLRRSVTFDRRAAGGAIEVHDDFALSHGGSFQSVLVTPLDASLAPGEVRIGKEGAGVAVRFDTDALQASTEIHRGVEKQYAPAVDLTRVLFTPKSAAASGSVKLRITPL